MAIANTWLVVAAEAREFDGILRRFGTSLKLDWPARFARQAQWNGDRWWLVANGPGPRLAGQALESKMDVSGIISTGFCGALDPALCIGDIVVDRSGRACNGPRPAVCGEVVSMDRVAIAAAEKRDLRARTGAIAVEMESAAVAQKAVEWGVPFYGIRSVSDLANEDMPLDFNRYRDADGRFVRGRIALAALAHPFLRVPALLRLERNCQVAAEALGDFFADCRF